MFADRHDAGRELAGALRDRVPPDPIVIGLPRGGVIVAAEVARQLGAPLDIIVVRKLGCPWQPELGVGAIAEGGVRVVNEGLVRELGLTGWQLDEVTTRETRELERRVQRDRGQGRPVEVDGRSVVVVDDGLATGYTARAAVEALRRRGAAHVTVAVPIASEDEAAALRDVADAVIAILEWPVLFGISDAYEDFGETSDDEVISAIRAMPGAAPPG